MLLGLPKSIYYSVWILRGIIDKPVKVLVLIEGFSSSPSARHSNLKLLLYSHDHNLDTAKSRKGLGTIKLHCNLTLNCLNQSSRSFDKQIQEQYYYLCDNILFWQHQQCGGYVRVSNSPLFIYVPVIPNFSFGKIHTLRDWSIWLRNLVSPYNVKPNIFLMKRDIINLWKVWKYYWDADSLPICQQNMHYCKWKHNVKAKWKS